MVESKTLTYQYVKALTHQYVKALTHQYVKALTYQYVKALFSDMKVYLLNINIKHDPGRHG